MPLSQTPQIRAHHKNKPTTFTYENSANELGSKAPDDLFYQKQNFKPIPGRISFEHFRRCRDTPHAGEQMRKRRIYMSKLNCLISYCDAMKYEQCSSYLPFKDSMQRLEISPKYHIQFENRSNHDLEVIQLTGFNLIIS